MARCRICERQMLFAEGCIPHNILLEDGRVIETPAFDPDDEHGFGRTGRCHDCGAEPGGLHHASCDNAREENGDQILIQAVAYWDPESEPDPRSAESDHIFIVMLEPDEENEWEDAPKPLTAFDSQAKAEAYMDQEDWAEFSMDILRVRSKVPGVPE